MARRVFFSFHFQRDSHRVSQIRNCNVISNHFEEVPFLDHAKWETIERQGDTAIRNWIDSNMHGASVIVVLAGYETYNRRWVKYELEKAHSENRGIVCIDMAGMKNMFGHIDPSGINPLATAKDSSGRSLASLGKYKTYSWLGDLGRFNIDDWITAAAENAGR
ncbi:TIR domain-containing protein [Hymenobacter pini]|uniref:TIR domain-containing protein n=1 Tax=Hymenobacter pini TaxID=2880879 RepID=UPI001CF406FF|nr:TIR domain-containing protein [Hymenobacter pini]MCA8830151.1 TIR domain-containing protein [Hymenobacter pini]